MITLRSDNWRLWLDPQRGVQWLAAEARTPGGNWRAVVPDCRPPSVARLERDGRRAGQDEKAPLAAANFHLIPYSNRIRDARFRFAGERIQLDGAQCHAIHGALAEVPWEVIDSSENALRCRFDSGRGGPINWPWPIESYIHYTLDGNRLESSITIHNRGQSPMPAGTGWHPYFVRHIDGYPPTLTLPVTGVFPDTDGDCLPRGAPVSLPDALDFRSARELTKDHRIDHCLSGFAGSAVITWPGTGIRLDMTASRNCRFLVLYNPAMPHFAVEPVTNANDGFNLDAAGIAGGTEVLEPDAELSASLAIALAVDG